MASIPTSQKHKLQRRAYNIDRPTPVVRRSPGPPLHRPPAAWTYWELRCPWQGGKQDWKTLPTSLFTANTVEDFWMCYSRTPKIT